MRTTARITRRASMTQPLVGKENHNPSQRTSATPPSGRKARHRLSAAEVTRLEDVFRQETHPSRQQKKDLATELGMDYKTVTIWFQNKRQTSKRCRPPAERSDQTAGRTRADSCLRTVSSPSHNATLDASGTDSTIEPPENKRPEEGLNAITAKAIVKIKPLLDSLNALTSGPRGRAESVETRDEEPSVEESEPHWPQTLSDDSFASAEWDRCEGIAEEEQPRGKPAGWKRTLEWACERQAKRRKLSREAYVRLGSEETEDYGNSNGRRMDSALSLLSLASSRQGEPPGDVMSGASLLLSFKHSWRRK